MEYIQFLTKNNSGEIDDLLGSDGIMRVDGRISTSRQITYAHERKEQLKNIRPEICGYKIFKGDRISDNNHLKAEGLFYDNCE